MGLETWTITAIASKHPPELVSIGVMASRKFEWWRSRMPLALPRRREAVFQENRDKRCLRKEERMLAILGRSI